MSILNCQLSIRRSRQTTIYRTDTCPAKFRAAAGADHTTRRTVTNGKDPWSRGPKDVPGVPDPVTHWKTALRFPQGLWIVERKPVEFFSLRFSSTPPVERSEISHIRLWINFQRFSKAKRSFPHIFPLLRLLLQKMIYGYIYFLFFKERKYLHAFYL